MVVLPTDPVIPTTSAPEPVGPGRAANRSRATRASCGRPAAGSPTSMAATPSGRSAGAGWAVRKAEAPRSRASTMKSWPSRASTMGTNNAPDGSSRVSMPAPSTMTSSPTSAPPVAAAISRAQNLIDRTLEGARYGPGHDLR